jgi:hypothetical protein
MREGDIPASEGRQAPLRTLHGAHEVTTFSQESGPPRLRGTTWSIVRRPVPPQYWQRYPSRARIARLESLRFPALGRRTYERRRMTVGETRDSLSDRMTPLPASTISAFCFSNSTTALRVEHTFIGS